MKRILLMTVLTTFILSASAQSAIDRLFEKYQGSKGFTTVIINGNMLKLIAALDDDDNDDEVMKHADKFTSIRILAQEDGTVTDDNFYDMVTGEVEKGGYEELVTVNSSETDLKILVKADGKVFREFLLITGGDDNAIIQIKGNMTFDEVKEMSESVKDDRGFKITGIH